MGNFNLYYTKIIKGMAVSLLSFSSALGQPAQGDAPSLGEAFNAGAPEVEPVVVGRERGVEAWRSVSVCVDERGSCSCVCEGEGGVR